MKETFQVKVWNFSLKLIFNHMKLKQLKYKFLKIIIKITPETDSSYSCFIKKIVLWNKIQNIITHGDDDVKISERKFYYSSEN